MFLLFVDSSTNVSFEAEYDYQREDYLIESTHVSGAGRRYNYVWSKTDRMSFSVRYVDSATAATVNSWWSIRATLFFQESGSSDVYPVHILNDETPIGEFEKPYTSLFKGTLELESYV